MSQPETSSPPIILHIWPGVDSALSLDPPCVTAFLFLQTIIKGRFSVSYCSSPDLSPNGQLPFLTHGSITLSGLLSIVRYVSKLSGAFVLDDHLSEAQRAQSTARVAHVQSELGDLVAYVYFSLHANWYQKTRATLTSSLPLPQRFYLPSRLRESYKPRLEAARLWNVADHEAEGDKKSAFSKEKKKKDGKSAKGKAKDAFEREKVLEKARVFFTAYVDLLGSKQYFYHDGNGPTSLDIVFASHIHLLDQSLPNPLLQELLKSSFPTLLAHAKSVYNFAFPDSSTFPRIVASPSASVIFSLKALLPSSRLLFLKPKRKPTATGADVEEEKKFTRVRWGFFGAVGLTVVAYVYVIGLPMLAAALRQVRERLEEIEAAEEAERGVEVIEEDEEDDDDDELEGDEESDGAAEE